jgi:hypothetical protein
MGRTAIHDTGETIGAICTREFSANNPGIIQFSVIDQSTRGNVWYSIARIDRPNENPLFYGLVWLVNRRRGEFIYKDMSEDCGPFYYDMPARLLDQLDKLAPNAPESALNWRAKCRAHIAAKRKTKTIVKKGDIVRFSPHGADFELLAPAGPRRGWHVRLLGAAPHLSQYRANARQISQCQIVDPLQFLIRDEFKIINVQ